VDVHCDPSPTLAPLLERLVASVVLTVPHLGNLVVLTARRGRVRLSFHTFELKMGKFRAVELALFCGDDYTR
jgi:hypothetical protein